MPKGTGNKDLAEFIRLRRVSLGISRSDAATACQLDRSYWNKLENAHYHQPAPNLLQRIAQLLQVAPDDLYTLAGYAIPKKLADSSAISARQIRLTTRSYRRPRTIL